MKNLFRVPIRRACEVVNFTRSIYYYKSRRDRQEFLRMRIKEISQTRIHYGYRRIYILLKREGWEVNHKRVLRLYREEGLNENWFLSIEDARVKIQKWWREYNEIRPHSGINNLTPREYLNSLPESLLAMTS